MQISKKKLVFLSKQSSAQLKSLGLYFIRIICQASLRLWAFLVSFNRTHTAVANTPVAAIAIAWAIGACYGADMTLIIVGLILAFIFASIAICNMNNLSRTSKVGCSAFVFFGLTIEGILLSAKHYNEITNTDTYNAVKEMIKKQNEYIEKSTLSENPAPLLPDNNNKIVGACSTLNSKYNVIVGTNTYGSSDKYFVAIAVKRKPFLSVKYDEDGGLTVSFNLFNENGQILASVKNNKVFVPPIGKSYIQARQNLHSIEVMDEFGGSKMSIYFANPTTIQISAEFYMDGFKYIATQERQTGPLVGVAICNMGGGIGLNFN